MPTSKLRQPFHLGVWVSHASSAHIEYALALTALFLNSKRDLVYAVSTHSVNWSL